MKGFIVIAFVLLCSTTYAQTTRDYDLVKIETPAQCKAAEPMVLEAGNYLLLTPFEKDNKSRQQSISFIVKWMGATPDYSLPLDEFAIKTMKGNNDLLGLYMAAMTKYALDHKALAQDKKLVKLNAITMVLNYCENVQNNMKMTKQLKKLSEAKANGTLEQAL